MVEARELSRVFVCIPCRDKAGNGIGISISWHGNFYGCEHIELKDLMESGLYR